MKILTLLAILIVKILPGMGQSVSCERKLGYADVDYIFSNLPVAKAIQAELRSTQAQLEAQIASKTDELKQKYAHYTKSAPAMIEPVRANTLRELELLEGNLEKFQEDAQATLQKKHSQLTDPVFKSIAKAIDDVATENDFLFIFNPGVTGFNVVLFADRSADVSDLVLKKLGVGTTNNDGKSGDAEH